MIGGAAENVEAALESNYQEGMPLGDACARAHDALQRAENGDPDLGPRTSRSACSSGARTEVPGRKFRRRRLPIDRSRRPMRSSSDGFRLLARSSKIAPLVARPSLPITGRATGRSGGRAVQKRIFGVETEYGIIFTPEGRKTLPVEKAIRFLFEKLITTEHFLNVFLENGARFYQDTGCHPEYATPECACAPRS